MSGSGNTWQKGFEEELKHIKKGEEASKKAKEQKQKKQFYDILSEIWTTYAEQLNANPNIAKRLTDVQNNPGKDPMLQLSEIVASLAVPNPAPNPNPAPEQNPLQTTIQNLALTVWTEHGEKLAEHQDLAKRLSDAQQRDDMGAIEEIHAIVYQLTLPTRKRRGGLFRKYHKPGKNPVSQQPPKPSIAPAVNKAVGKPQNMINAAANPQKNDDAAEQVKNLNKKNEQPENLNKIIEQPQNDQLVKNQIKLEEQNKEKGEEPKAEADDREDWLKQFIEDYKDDSGMEEPENARHAWDMTKEELDKNEFNPGADPDLDKVQEEIKKAGDVNTAFYAFADWAGSVDARSVIESDELKEIDLKLFKRQLMQMTRVIKDFPELKGRFASIGKNPGKPFVYDKEYGYIQFILGAIERRNGETGLGKAEKDASEYANFMGVAQIGEILNRLKDVKVSKNVLSEGYNGISGNSKPLENALMDVYSHGSSAKKESIDIVKKYIDGRKKARFLKPKKNMKKEGEKRPWEMTKADFTANPYNPGKSPELKKVQDDIDASVSISEAFRILMRYAGSPEAKPIKEVPGKKPGTKEWVDWDLDKEGFDPKQFKGKLKNLARQIYDFPMLRHQIGSFKRIDVNSDTNAAIESTLGSTGLHYNPKYDLNTKKSKQAYKDAVDELEKNQYRGTQMIAKPDFSFNHEFGHLSDMVLDSNGKIGHKKEGITATGFYRNGISASRIIQTAFRRRLNLKRDHMSKILAPNGGYGSTIKLKDKEMLEYNYTSGYGNEKPVEFFAEAIKDVYAHGADARPISIEIMKVYEEAIRERLLTQEGV